MRIPQRDGKNVNATARLVAFHRHQISEKARSRFENPEFRRRSEPASEYDEVEVHLYSLSGKCGEDSSYRMR